MKYSYIIILGIIAICQTGFTQSNREYIPFASTVNTTKSVNPFIKNDLLHRNSERDHSFPATSVTGKGTKAIAPPVPTDIADLSGKWYNKKNNCIVTMTWNGRKWVAIVDGENKNEFLRPGEIIGELEPISPKEVYGRLKVMKKDHSFKWEEVKYKTSLTELKGKNNWIFWSL